MTAQERAQQIADYMGLDDAPAHLVEIIEAAEREAWNAAIEAAADVIFKRTVEGGGTMATANGRVADIRKLTK